mmetsp:Transcript_40927/g.128214  ORF Transcript_40927/g.128214 Transcript_40927/m.128214 type:complete len:154 (+) Transcript_40927:359-820(+)
MRRVVAQVMRQCPYSPALGPPRKVLYDVDVEDHHYTLPEGALLFVMHPGLERGSALPPPLRIRGDGGAADEEEQAVALRMFGAGPRSCIAAETSFAFLGQALALVLKKWRWSLPGYEDGGDDADHLARDLLAYTGDGSLLVPLHDTPLKFESV